MSNHGRISELFIGGSILHPFAGPLRRTVPAILKAASQEIPHFQSLRRLRCLHRHSESLQKAFGVWSSPPCGKRSFNELPIDPAMMPYPDNNSDKVSGCECSSERIPIIPTIIPTKCRDRRHEMAGKPESRHESRQCVAIPCRYRRPPSNREIGKWESCVNASLSWQSLRCRHRTPLPSPGSGKDEHSHLEPCEGNGVRWRVRRNFITEELTFCGSLFLKV